MPKVTLSGSEEEKTVLSHLAETLGFVRGASGNVSGLIGAIARGHLTVTPALSEDRLRALGVATRLLFDVGQISEAQELVNLLLERPELGEDTRQELLAFSKAASKLPPWREELSGYLKSQTQFLLSFHDPLENWSVFLIEHGRVTCLGQHAYLEFWGAAVKNSEELGKPQHWQLRLDRVGVDALVTPVKVAI